MPESCSDIIYYILLHIIIINYLLYIRAPLQKVLEICSDRDGWSRWSYLGLVDFPIYGRNWLISDFGCTLVIVEDEGTKT